MSDNSSVKLPDEWDQFIPPPMVEVISYEGRVDGVELCGTRPVWNGQWLAGLESFVRDVVRDEMEKARRRHGHDEVTGVTESTSEKE